MRAYLCVNDTLSLVSVYGFIDTTLGPGTAGSLQAAVISNASRLRRRKGFSRESGVQAYYTSTEPAGGQSDRSIMKRCFLLSR